MPEQPTLYDKVVSVTRSYLGPAAERFIGRQVQSHLHKEPQKMTAADLAVLIDWIRVAVALLTDEEAVIEEYVSHLRTLASGSGVRKKSHGRV